MVYYHVVKNAPLPFLQASTLDFGQAPCYWTLWQEEERPQRMASNPCPHQPFFTWPEVQLQLGSPEHWDETHTGQRAGGPLTSLQLALLESSQALTRLKGLHVHDADCVSTCTTQTASGALIQQQMAPADELHQPISVRQPCCPTPTSRLSYPMCLRSRSQSADLLHSRWSGPLGLGVQGWPWVTFSGFLCRVLNLERL